MIRADMIPDEAVLAALLTDERLGMREVITAALNAWPGVKWHHDYKGDKRDIILPMPLKDVRNYVHERASRLLK